MSKRARKGTTTKNEKENSLGEEKMTQFESMLKHTYTVKESAIAFMAKNREQLTKQVIEKALKMADKTDPAELTESDLNFAYEEFTILRDFARVKMVGVALEK